MTLSKGDLTRRKIIKSSIQVFAELGFADASFREIAKRAKLKTPLIAHHFETKYRLYAACVDEVITHFSELWTESIDVEDGALTRLEKIFLSNLELADHSAAEVKLIIFLYFTASHDPVFKKIYDGLLMRVRKRYLETIHSGIREKIFDLECSPEVAAEILHENVIGGIVNYLSAKNRPDERSRLIEKWSRLIFSITGAQSKILVHKK
jgi:AcrR family transcriptional regulator